MLRGGGDVGARCCLAPWPAAAAPRRRRRHAPRPPSSAARRRGGGGEALLRRIWPPTARFEAVGGGGGWLAAQVVPALGFGAAGWAEAASASPYKGMARQCPGRARPVRSVDFLKKTDAEKLIKEILNGVQKS